MNPYAQIHRVLPPLLLFSFVTNLAVLVSPLFMMQVLDRVLPSGNTGTLLLLAAIALSALLLQAVIEGALDVSLGRLSRWTERAGTVLSLAPNQPNTQERLNDVGRVSQFIGGSTVLSALNIPWIPLFLLALYLVHPSFLVLFLGMVSVSLAGLALLRTHINAEENAASMVSGKEQETLQNTVRFAAQPGAETSIANLRKRFSTLQSSRHTYLDRRQTSLSASKSLASFVRSSGQIMALGLGAFLVTTDQLSAGGMIAAAIIVGKGYATTESTLSQWTGIRDTLQIYRRMRELPPAMDAQVTEVPALSGDLRAEGLIVPRGGGAPPRLDRVSLSLKAGECLAIVGSSGSGKTTLLHALSGVSPAPIGSVFLDESEVRGLSARERHQFTGYLPQQASFVAGTISENIASFDPEAIDAKVVDVAKRTGVHGMISALPNSYGTDIGAEPHLLSGGQYQRLALARALYTQPDYLFLDEPNALLDAEGEKAVFQTLNRLKSEGTTIVMTLHRFGFMGLADKVLYLRSGRVADFGSRAEVLGRLGVGGRRIEVPLRETSAQDLSDWIASQFTRSGDEEFAQRAEIVAAELFSDALLFADPEASQTVGFMFTFVDDTNCEVVMIENGDSDLEDRMTKVRAHLERSNQDSTGLPRDAASLATVARLSDGLEITSSNDMTRCVVRLTGGAEMPARTGTHN